MDCYSPKSLALTGATGALGFAFLQAAFARHPHLRGILLVRQTSASFKAAEFQAWLTANRDRITLVDGDLRQMEPAQIEPLLHSDGGIWHFAALTTLTAESEELAREIHAVNFEGTRRLLEVWEEKASGLPFYHISTAYVVGQRKGVARETESAMNQGLHNPYEASKLAAEGIVLQAFARGMRGAIFRPSIVVDDRGGTGGIKLVDACAYAVALAIKRREPFVFRLPLTACLNLIHSDWVIDAMLDLARMPSGSGWTYHLTSPQETYFQDIAKIVEKLVPHLKVSFEPDRARAELPVASRLFEKAVAELRHYLESGIHFDRTHTDRDISPKIREQPFALSSFVENRLRTEMERIAHRR